MIALALLLATPAASAPQIVAQAEQPQVEVWQLDQVRIPRDTDPKKVDGLGPLHSLDAVVAYLKQQGVDYRRGKVSILPDRLPDQLRAALLQLPPGEPFVLPEPDFISISVLIGRKLPPGSVSYRPHRPFPLPTKA